MRHKVSFHINEEEHRILRDIIDNNDITGFDCDSDFWRLLLWRENHRRKGLGPPPERLWRAVHRQQDYPKRTRAGKLCQTSEAIVIHNSDGK